MGMKRRRYKEKAHGGVSTVGRERQSWLAFFAFASATNS